MTETTTKVRICDQCGTDVTHIRHLEIAYACRSSHFGVFLSEEEKHFCGAACALNWIAKPPDDDPPPKLPLEKR